MLYIQDLIQASQQVCEVLVTLPICNRETGLRVTVHLVKVVIIVVYMLVIYNCYHNPTIHIRIQYMVLLSLYK